jgi:hypothetical protein
MVKSWPKMDIVLLIIRRINKFLDFIKQKNALHLDISASFGKDASLYISEQGIAPTNE